jgi:glycosyltransferase involved in cell wall biosynthesis
MARIGIDASIVLHGERAGQRHSRNLLKQLVGQFEQDDWRLLYFDRKGNTPGRISFVPSGVVHENVSRIPMRLLSNPWRILGSPAVEDWLGSIDVFYAPDLCFPPTRRAPVLCTIRGVAYLAIPKLCAPAQVRALTRAFAYARRRAHHFLAVSESTRQDLLRLTDLRADRIHVVTHGVDPVFRTLEREECRRAVLRKFGVSRHFLLYVGVIGRHKNITGLLRAFSDSGLHRQGLDLILAGPFESEIGTMRSMVSRSGLESAVHFIGSVSQQDDTLVELYNAALALVHPSFYEGWCSTPLEAMACGTPVVGSDIPSVREVVQEAALLVPPDDIDGLKLALLRVVEDESCRADLAERGLAHAGQHTWERSAQRLRRVLARVQQAGR